jgi:hypothetical protein
MGGLRRVPGRLRRLLVGQIYVWSVAACPTREELEQALRAPKSNERAIRATLSDRDRDGWALPTLEAALQAAQPAQFRVLKAVARPTVSRKRVKAVCGLSPDGPWTLFFDDKSSASTTAAQKPAVVSQRVVTPSPKTTGKTIPLTEAGELVRQRIARDAEAKRAQDSKAGKGKKKRAPDPFLETVVQCRECLRPYKRVQLPNPKRRICEDCGGQPESKSVRTVSGGSPGLGRRR